jgi:hypothetical protein
MSWGTNGTANTPFEELYAENVKEYNRIIHHFTERCKNADLIKKHTEDYEGMLFNAFSALTTEDLEKFWFDVLEDLMSNPYWTSVTFSYAAYGGATPPLPKSQSPLKSQEVLLIQELLNRNYKFNKSP